VGATLSPTTWLPFGGGARRCLGATFAMTEMRVVLREVLRRTELVPTTTGGERQRVKHVILTPDRGGLIEVARLLQPGTSPASQTGTRVAVAPDHRDGVFRSRGT